MSAVALRRARQALPVPGVPALLFAGVGFVFLSLIVPPIAILLHTSFSVADSLTESHLALDNYTTVLGSPELPQLLTNTILFAGGSSLVALVLGTLLAWLVERTNARAKSLAYLSAFTALAVPGIVKAIGWVFLLGPRNGILTTGFEDLLGQPVPFYLHSLEGMALVSGLLATPGVFLLMSIPFRAMDAALEEAAAMSGADSARTFSRVTLPLALPAIISVLLLTFVQAVEAFELPAVVGIPGRVFVLTTQIYQSLRGGLFPEYGVASAYSVILIGLVLVGIWFYARATRNAQKFFTITGKGYRPRVIELGQWRPLATALLLLLPLLVVLPVLVLMWASLQPFYAMPSVEALSRLTLEKYQSVLADRTLQRSVTNTLIVGVLAATLTVLLTAIAAWVSQRTKLRGRSLLDQLASFTLVFPGVVLGVALLKTFLVFQVVPIYGTIWILVIAYVTRLTPYAMRYAQAGLAQIHSELEESAQASGAGWWSTFTRILGPLMAPALFAAWVFVFLSTVSELSMAVMLVGPSSQLIATTIFDLYEFGLLSEMAAVSVLVSTAFVALSLAVQRLTRRWGTQTI